jgi:hypothetical protein
LSSGQAGLQVEAKTLPSLPSSYVHGPRQQLRKDHRVVRRLFLFIPTHFFESVCYWFAVDQVVFLYIYFNCTS